MKHYRTFTRRKSDRIDVVRLHELAGKFRVSLRQPLTSFLAQSESLLAQHAQPGQPDSDVFFNQLSELRTQKTDISALINAAFDEWFDWQEGQRPTKEEFEEEQRSYSMTEWSLMEDHSLEKSMAIERFSGRVIMGSDGHWTTFYQRLSVLTADRGLSEKNAPFNPNHLGNLIFDALDATELSFQIKNMVFRLFDEVAAAHLINFYKEQNTWLIEQQILPKLDVMDAHIRRTPRVDANVVQQIKGTLSQGSEQGINIEPKVLENLLKSISLLQNQNEEIPDVGDLEAVKNWTSFQAKTITQQFQGTDKSDTIALVSMLFEYFFDDPQLVDKMKHLLAKMQIPMIKVAILDQDFFDNFQHPARRLLNKMARAAVAWQPSDNLDGDELLLGMEGIVQRLTLEFNDDISLFDELLKVFESLKTEYDKSKEEELNETRSLEHKALSEHESQDRARIFLDHLLEKDGTPEIVRNFLNSRWYKLMHFILRKQGESQNWRNSARIAKELVWSLSSDSQTLQVARFRMVVPKMLSGLNDGLNAIELTEEERYKLLSCISEVHDNNKQKTPQLESDAAISEGLRLLDEQLMGAEDLITGPLPLKITEPVFDQTPADLNYYLPLIEEMQEEQWFDYTQGESRIRVFLFMIISDGAKYVFTDNDGKKILERSAIGFAMALREGLLIPLDSDALIERTLKTVAENTVQTDIKSR